MARVSGMAFLSPAVMERIGQLTTPRQANFADRAHQRGRCVIPCPPPSAKAACAIRAEPPMLQFSIPDMIALAVFVGAWSGYALAVEVSARGRDGLNARMNRYREVWMRRMLARDMRMVDMQIMASLQNGTAFFASTSLIAIGAALTLLRSTDEILSVVATLPFGI